MWPVLFQKIIICISLFLKRPLESNLHPLKPKGVHCIEMRVICRHDAGPNSFLGSALFFMFDCSTKWFGIFFSPRSHVGAKSALLRLIFCLQQEISHLTASLLLLFRKKSRSACLFGCRRLHDGSLSLSTFCELRAFNSHLPKAENIFFILLRQKVQFKRSLNCIFPFCMI